MRKPLTHLLMLAVIVLTCAVSNGADYPPLAGGSVQVNTFIDRVTGARYLVFYVPAQFKSDTVGYNKGIAMAASAPVLVVVRADLPPAILDQPLEKK